MQKRAEPENRQYQHALRAGPRPVAADLVRDDDAQRDERGNELTKPGAIPAAQHDATVETTTTAHGMTRRKRSPRRTVSTVATTASNTTCSPTRSRSPRLEPAKRGPFRLARGARQPVAVVDDAKHEHCSERAGAGNRVQRRAAQGSSARLWQARRAREQPEHQQHTVGAREREQRERDAGTPGAAHRSRRPTLEKSQRQGDEPRDEPLLDAADGRDRDGRRGDQERAADDEPRQGHAAPARLEPHAGEREEHAGEAEKARARNTSVPSAARRRKGRRRGNSSSPRRARRRKT